MMPGPGRSYDDVQSLNGGAKGEVGEDGSDDDEDYSFQGSKQPQRLATGAAASSGANSVQRRASSHDAIAAAATAAAEATSGTMEVTDFANLSPAESGALPDAHPTRLGGPGGVSMGRNAAHAGASALTHRGHTASQLTVNLPSGPSTGQLGLLRDRKGGVGNSDSRRITGDGYASSPGPISPMTPFGSVGALVSGAANAGTHSGSGTPLHGASLGASAIPRLPNLLPAAPSRAGSKGQIVMGPAYSVGALAAAISPGGGTDSRPGTSSRVRGVFAASSDPNLDAHGSPGHSSGGRWYQQDTADVDAVLAGEEEAFQRLMAAQRAGGGGGGPMPDDGYGGGGPSGDGFHLPQLGNMMPDRAELQLQELRKYQANLDDHITKERQALVTGRVRRSSVLEELAGGAQQPRWQMTYNNEAAASHAKLGTVDPTRKSEMDNARLARIAKDSKAPGMSAASASPVVARARRLSTVMA
ncbi:hypothetical protein HXX76_004287 [Chlamydomonas incerta]|uniref:Uncharacterized protein n=1 Tax=Chlamydomonas incerta TaxID=51695 RepID=A0A835W7L8_CHLIN|nr:hypothetical protein HXX76_004287 [Chlamydomonas incerta]|eukprot:KAG2440174.1 hypothetical protein HXX76_004287 [Chlamydomonas incerta]